MTEVILENTPIIGLEPAPTITLNEVFSITKIDQAGVTYACSVNMTTPDGDTFDAVHVYRATDPHGLSPILKQWLIDNPNFPIGNYVEPPAPTIEQVRAEMLPLTPRQLRLTLVRSGISLASVADAIAAMPNGLTKEETAVEWEYATTFERTSPALLAIADALYMTPEAVDTLWSQAVAA